MLWLLVPGAVCLACCGLWGGMEWYLRHDPQGWYFRELDRRDGEDR